MLDSVTRDSATPVSAHFPKTPRAPPTPPSTGTTPSLPGPDLDRSAISMAQDHLTSGSTSSTVSLSGDYRDASGKVIRRPQFVLDMESKEEYFIELILSRHARKLLTATCLRDLGKFAAHLDFSLEKWLARERLRAARIDNLLATVRQLHKEFQWPLPPSDSKPTPTPVPPAELHSRPAWPALSRSSSTEGGDSPNNKQAFSPDSDTASVCSSLRRPHRPPDLDLSSLNLTPISHQDITIHTSSHPPPPLPDDKKGAELTEQPPSTTDVNEATNRKGREVSVLSSATDLDPTRSSTPLTAKMSGTSEGLPAETSSLGDIEESDWEVDSDLCVPTTPEITMATRGSALAEREIRGKNMYDIIHYTHSNNEKCLQKRFIGESNLPKTDGKVL
ncbi:Guanine nucleotide exchange factor subunit RIC1 [Geodia barretti]|uniref:Guanine nucleotide exchange factor subunit RIC1 n=1 Tax=Geodia barretti TaxID=519541 RepID=A0AA35W8N3_GEOBA|nr:Guanine nucleotide exchange factor subunit RIC1 [Geodia barretti]